MQRKLGELRLNEGIAGFNAKINENITEGRVLSRRMSKHCRYGKIHEDNGGHDGWRFLSGDGNAKGLAGSSSCGTWNYLGPKDYSQGYYGLRWWYDSVRDRDGFAGFAVGWRSYDLRWCLSKHAHDMPLGDRLGRRILTQQG